MWKLCWIIPNIFPLLFVSCSGKPARPIDDNTLIALALSGSYEDGGYTVVDPMTNANCLSMNDPQSAKQSKEFIRKRMRFKEHDLTNLIDLLFERNKTPVRLTLASSPKDGFVIDYEGTYEKYFERDGGGWDKWYKENPKAHGFTRISLPAYDLESKLMLICTETQLDWEMGSGWLILYRFENGRLKELTRVLLWMS